MSTDGSTAPVPSRPRPLVPFPHRDRGVAATLPSPLTSFVGRERERAAVHDLLGRPDVRLVTLTGPGGVGKTRLALTAAQELAAADASGVCFVPLAAITNPALVASTIAQALGVREESDRPLPASLIDALRNRELLLLLDNFEHLLAAAPLVTELLEPCPAVKVLVTSRVRLRLSGEHELAVPPLVLPDPRPLPALPDLAQSEAVTLFLQRARAVRPDLTLTDENAVPIAEICRRLDGLPLAIELAAARSKHLPPPALLSRLVDRLGVLTGGPRDQPARLQTMRDAVAWSYELLDEGEQALFRRLAVCAGGFTEEAAGAVVGDGSGDWAAGASPTPIALFDGLTALVDASLLRQEAGPDGEVRYGMLETIRAYGLERLTAHGEADAVRKRHASWCLALAERGSAELLGPERSVWMGRLEIELDNFRSALSWCLGHGDVEPSLRLAALLGEFWVHRGRVHEGREWLEQALAVADRTEPAIRAFALLWVGGFGWVQGDHASGAAWLEESLALYRELGDRGGMARALIWLGNIAFAQGDLDRNEALLEEALVLTREVGDRYALATILNNLSGLADRRGDQERAEALGDEALALDRKLGNPDHIAVSLINQGIQAYRRGDLAKAETLEEEALAIWQDLKAPARVALTHFHLGEVARARGDYTAAAAHYRESLVLDRELDNVRHAAINLMEQVIVAQACGQAELAARLLGAAEALDDWRAHSLLPEEVAEYEAAVAAARATLGEATFTAAWAAGRMLTFDEAIAAASEVATEPLRAVDAPPAVPTDDPFGLTAREREVLQLLVQRATDKEIADALFISPRTVASHVANILGKLGVTSRREAAAVAVERELA